jgi:hypothetical protein
MSTELQGITNSKFRMWLRADGIVQLVWAPGEALGLDDAVAAKEAASALSGGQKCPILADARGGGTPDRQARGVFAHPSDLMSAVAMLVDTPLTRMMGNFPITVSKPAIPTRLFDDEGPAVAWLTEFLP